MTDPSLEALVEEYLQRRELGTAEGLEEFLAKYPTKRSELARILAEDEEVAGALTRDRTYPKAGESFGRYRLLDEIGRGGMGVLFEAENEDGERVALKLLSPTLALSDSAADRFHRECSTTARLQHPGIVRVIEIGKERGVDFLAMEILHGGGLDRFVAQKKAATKNSVASWVSHFRDVVAIVARVADALEHAHRAGVIHRDIKPSNILLREDGTPVLTDFGLAREHGLPSLTSTGDFAGTPYYVSPEQALGGRARIDERSDVYSLGVTLYELLTLEPPFPGSSAPEVFAKVVTKDAPDPRIRNPAIDRKLVQITLKALERDPDRRYATAADFGSDLRAWIEGRETLAKPPTLLDRWNRFRRAQPAKSALLAAGAILFVMASFGAAVYVPRVREAERMRSHQQFRRDLDDAFVTLVGLRPDLAQRRFEALDRVASGDPEVLVGRVLAIAFEGNRTAAKELAERAAGAPGAPPIWRHILLALDRGNSADALIHDEHADDSAFRHFVDGAFLLVQGTEGTSSLLREACDAFGRATVRATTPRLSYVFGRAQAAYYVRNESVAGECAATARTLWPDSVAAAWCQVWDLSLRDPKAAIARAKLLLRDSGLANSDIELDLLYSIARSGDRAFVRTIASEFDPGGGKESKYAFVIGTCLLRAGDTLLGIEFLKRAVLLEPTNIVTQRTLGQALLGAGDLDGAVRHLLIAFRMDPCHAPTLAHLGSALAQNGDLSTGRAMCEQALLLAPQIADVFFPLCTVFAIEGDEQSCADFAKLAIERSPNIARGYALRAAACLALGDKVEADAMIHSAQLLAEPSARIFQLQGELLALRGERESALAAYRKALELEPENGTIVTAFAQLAAKYGHAAEGQHAAEEYARIVDSAGAWNDCAWTFVDPTLPDSARDPELAHEYASVAVSLDPDLAPAVDTLAWALFFLGRYDEAKDRSDRALALARKLPRWATSLPAFEQSHSDLAASIDAARR